MEGNVRMMKNLLSLGALVLMFFLPMQALGTTIYQKDSLYSHIRVDDTLAVRTLYFNASPQTTMFIRDPRRGAFEYTELMHSALAIKPELKKVLVLGLGGGSISKAFYYRYPEVSVTTVEIDPVVVEVARKYFFVPEDARHRIVISDARRFLASISGSYDAILIDAYLADYYGAYVPFHLATREFFGLVEKNLSPGGVVAYNVIGQINGWNGASVAAIYRTMASVFGRLYLFPASDTMNVVMVGVKGGNPPPLEVLKSQARAIDMRYRNLPVSISWVISRATLYTPDTRNAPILTDDYAPVETLPLFR